MLTLTSPFYMSPVCLTVAVYYKSLNISRKSTYGLPAVDISSSGRLISLLSGTMTLLPPVQPLFAVEWLNSNGYDILRKTPA